MGSAVVSTAPVGVPPTGRQHSPELTRLSQLAAEINDFSGVRSRNLLAY